MIRFGTLSIILLLGVVQGVVVTALLMARRDNREANRLLAALTFAWSLRIVPYVIGYAGFYDAYPWLSFAPFAITLAYGPLIYLYVVRLTEAALPRRWWLHLLPAAAQVVYDTAIFVQPLAFKNVWNDTVHRHLIDPAQTIFTFLSLGVYVVLAARRFRAYGRWLDDATSDAGESRLRWLRNFLVAFALTVALAAAFETYNAFVRPLNYYNFFALYVWYAALVYYLGLEGWRHAGAAYPQPVPVVTRSDPPPVVAGSVTPPDWPALGRAWRERVEAGAYWRDPELTLATLADALGMSPSQTSRIVNDGLGYNFSEAINRMRVDAVRARLADPGDRCDVLEIAFDCGFRSKASFNRAFKTYAGMTPTEYRRTPYRTTTMRGADG